MISAAKTKEPGIPPELEIRRWARRHWPGAEARFSFVCLCKLQHSFENKAST